MTETLAKAPLNWFVALFVVQYAKQQAVQQVYNETKYSGVQA